MFYLYSWISAIYLIYFATENNLKLKEQLFILFCSLSFSFSLYETSSVSESRFVHVYRFSRNITLNVFFVIFKYLHALVEWFKKEWYLKGVQFLILKLITSFITYLFVLYAPIPENTYSDFYQEKKEKQFWLKLNE